MKEINGFNEEPAFTQGLRYDIVIHGKLYGSLVFEKETYISGRPFYLFKDDNALDIHINPAMVDVFRELLVTEDELLGVEADYIITNRPDELGKEQ